METRELPANSYWCTPDSVLDVVRAISPRGVIDVDPASNDQNPTGATRFYTPTDNGLVQPWGSANEFVFLNPPYARGQIKRWVLNALACDVDSEIVLLLPADTSTKWFHSLAESGAAFAFFAKRIRFVGGENCADFASVLVYLGKNLNKFESVCRASNMFSLIAI